MRCIRGPNSEKASGTGEGTQGAEQEAESAIQGEEAGSETQGEEGEWLKGGGVRGKGGDRKK